MTVKADAGAIALDLTNMLAEPAAHVPGGIPIETLRDKAPLYERCLTGIEGRRQAGELGFVQLPQNVEMVDQVVRVAESCRGKFENYVHLGIGGSALGAITIFEALAHPYHNALPKEKRGGAPRMFFPENIDPRLIRSLRDITDVRNTLFHVVSLSGSTVETVASFLVFAQALKSTLGPEAYRSNVVISTDPEKGDLKRLAGDERIRLLGIPPGVGGRFSVLGPPGLLCAALLGADTRELLRGAESMYQRCAGDDMWKNPAFLFALLHFLSAQMRRVNITVLWSYCHALRRFGDWYCQLVAESLGKRNRHGKRVGLTPTGALGVTDQHSQLQLYSQGPRDKVVTFLAVEDLEADIEFPAAFAKYPSMDYLVGQSMSKLFQAERRATELSLVRSGCLNCSISLPRLSANTLGQLFMLFELAVCFLGELLEVNAFDQPGVEESKEYACALMGKPGSEDRRQELETHFAKQHRFVV